MASTDRHEALPDGPLRIDAAAAADATRLLAPASILLSREGRVAAIGAPEAVGATGDATVVRLERSVVLPGLVNAHTHLDLTAIGPRPFDAAGGFAEWADLVRRTRPSEPAAIAASVAAGVEASLQGGTAIVGDIAGNRGLEAFAALAATGFRGTSAIEVFGIGRAEDRGIEFLDHLQRSGPRGGLTRLAISPHASYSCGDRLYAHAAAMGVPLATHLAETREELQFCRDATGPLAELLRTVGAWSDDLVGWGCSPIERLAAILGTSGAAIAHGNYLSDRDLGLLAEAATRGPVGIVYCPRASAYFGHGGVDAPHRYRELLDRGVPVALGTDSIICLETPDRLSVLDEMRLLRRRDRVDLATLITMATVHGARLLQEDPATVSLAVGACPEGLLALDLEAPRPNASAEAWLDAALENPRPRWLLPPRWSRRP